MGAGGHKEGRDMHGGKIRKEPPPKKKAEERLSRTDV